MRVGIASPGPFMIARLHLLESCDFLIAVNRAIERVDADYWCFCDYSVFGMFTIPQGRDPILIVGPNVTDNIKPGQAGQPDHPDWQRFRLRRRLEWKHFRTVPPTHTWDSYSVVAALVAAVNLGASEIHTAGHDMTGTTDFRGTACEGRNETRWQEERTFWDQTTAWASASGVSVIRH